METIRPKIVLILMGRIEKTIGNKRKYLTVQKFNNLKKFSIKFSSIQFFSSFGFFYYLFTITVFYPVTDFFCFIA